MVVSEPPIVHPLLRVRAAARTVSRELAPAMGLGLPALLRHPVWARTGEGGGAGVVVVPGFGGADPAMATLRRWLSRRGYRPSPAGLGLNIGCTAELVGRLERRVEDHAHATGGPVVLVGHSRGGCLGRLVAVRRPDLVRGLAMLGSPVLDPLDAPGATAALNLLVGLSSLGLSSLVGGGLLDEDCLRGACGVTTAAALAAPLHPPAVSIYSRSDGVVGWRSCLDPGAECVEVGSSHAGMGTDPALYAVLSPRLAAWAAGSPVSGAA